MAGMYPVRSPFLSLAALLVLPVLALVGGCSSSDDQDPAGPTVTATGPEQTSSAPTATTGASTDTSTGTSADPSTEADAVEAVCAPYDALVAAVQQAAASSTDPEAIAAEIAPVLKEFAAQVPDLEPPPGVSADTWAGIEALAARIVALPDAPSRAEIQAVMAQLTDQERSAFDDASAWLKENCA